MSRAGPGVGAALAPLAAGQRKAVSVVLGLVNGARALVFVFLGGLLLAVAGLSPVMAADEATLFQRVMPAAERFGGMEGDPPAAAAYRGEALIGYVFSTRAVVASTGYSGKPLDIVVGIGVDGHITGAAIAEHHEPILAIGVKNEDLTAFVDQYVGRDVRLPAEVARGGGNGALDAVAGATVSSVVMNDAILQAARAVSRSRGILADASVLDLETFAPADWLTLTGENSLVALRVTVAQAEAAAKATGAALFAPGARPTDLAAPFIEIYFGLVTPARAGRNLLGDQTYNRLLTQLAEGDQLLFLAGRGLYSFKGTAYVRSGVFERIEVVQGERTFHFGSGDHRRIETLAVAGAPDLRELAALALPAASGFQPLQPWRLRIQVALERADGTPTYLTFEGEYTLPDLYRRRASAQASLEAEPLWQRQWRARTVDIAVLGVALVVLTGILVFQDFVTLRRRLYSTLRIGFLTFTLVWLGWYAGAQLTVVNILTFVQAILSEFSWKLFLMEPLMFILWGYIAVAMLFLGRGVFCGWLCPFGALQELLNRLARLAKVPQLSVPFALHERLWPIKYVVFLGLFALSLNALDQAQRYAEVEPFKTAIILMFDRSWPFVAYALALLGLSLFLQRGFCRYLCPLGAALAIPARLRMFEWLKRRWHCGMQCHQCEVECPVQAIHPDGHINPNECVHCLNCQVLYHDDYVCPPRIERRKRKERRTTAKAARTAAASAIPASPSGGSR